MKGIFYTRTELPVEMKRMNESTQVYTFLQRRNIGGAGL